MGAGEGEGLQERTKNALKGFGAGATAPVLSLASLLALRNIRVEPKILHHLLLVESSAGVAKAEKTMQDLAKAAGKSRTGLGPD
jgi:hypothetical protein